MAPWRYPDYLPKPPHLMTVAEWQEYQQGLSKQQQSDRYSGITSDLIPTFEMIQAQGAGEIDPDPYKRGSSRGSSFADQTFFNPRSSIAGTGQNGLDNPLTSDLDSVNLYGDPNASGGIQQQYGLARSIIKIGKGAVKVADKVADAVDDTLGTEEDPTAIRLGLEWATGTGPKERHLGPDSRFVQSFRNSDGIRLARDFLYDKYDGILEEGDNVTEYQVDFTYSIAAGAKTAAEQFIGSYHVNMMVGGGLIHFEAVNRSSMDSLLAGSWRGKHGLPKGPAYESGPGSNKYQYLTWTEPVVQREMGDWPVDPTAYG